MGKYFFNYIKKKINKQKHGMYTGEKARRNYMQVLRMATAQWQNYVWSFMCVFLCFLAK